MFQHHTHIDAPSSHDGTTHDHGSNQTHYPGEGVDAVQEAFNAYKLWHQKLSVLTSADQDKYTALVNKFYEDRYKGNF